MNRVQVDLAGPPAALPFRTSAVDATSRLEFCKDATKERPGRRSASARSGRRSERSDGYARPMGLKTIPQLPSDNLDATSEFYRHLGFVERGRWPNEYLVLERDDLELHFRFTGSLDPLTNEASCYVRFETAVEARDLYDQWAALGLKQDDLRPPVEPITDCWNSP